MAKERNSSISNALLSRKQILDLLRQLNLNKDFEPQEVNRICELLENYDEYFYPIIVKEFEKLDDEVLIQKYEYLLKFLDYQGFVPLLIELFPKTFEKPALRKAIINVLNYYRVGLKHPLYQKYLDHLLGRINQIKQKFMETDQNDLAKLTDIIKEFYLLETDEMVFTMRDLASNGKVVLPVLELFLRTGINTLIRETIKELSKIRDSRSLKVLTAAKNYLPYEYHSLIDESIKKLRLFAVVERKESERIFKIEKTLLSFPYLIRDRYATMSIKDGELYHFLFLVMTEHSGLHDYSMGRFNLNREQLEKVEAHFKRDLNLREVSFDYAAAILADSVRNNYLAEAHFPPPFTVASKFLPENFIKPVPYDPTTIKRVVKKEEKINIDEKSVLAVWKIIKPLNWLIYNERFKDIVHKWYMNSSKDSVWLDELLIRKCLRELIIPKLYKWKERLLLLADFLYNVKEKVDLVPVIIAISDSLNSNVEEMESNMFLRLFIKESKKYVLID